ncbi:2-dehydropantoate 2-reductase [Saccharopolyspora lacisalsi]|uniref:2-dehydropantoate 2-reductase n=1 Tax=Halosaccharopolyspora lacisalsi TaxID=1000566 RepID=A0A839E1U0_9PSEU|nr:2-dehydropantoate 2-reductase [Halosaccharopolyspora lacisalsi]MBA8825717.1 2-dehydropantoate 2-reductase [Halosaccharopolyspora lacisalsi]
MGAQHIAVIGSGAVGGVLAEALQAAGHHVTLCVRTPFEHLRVETPRGNRTVPVTVASDPAEVDRADWVVLTTKVQDAASAAPWLHRLDDGHTPLVVAQNGIEHRESVASLGLRFPLLKSLMYVAAERVSAGNIVRRSGIRLVTEATDLGHRFGDLFDDIDLERVEDFHTETWRKLLTNLAANPVTALTLRRLDVFRTTEVRELSGGVLSEAVAVGRAEGAQVTKADAERTLAGLAGDYSPENGTSMLYDRLAGLPTEHEHITGALVRAGQRAGIATPLNQALLTLLRAIRPERRE